MKQKDQLKTLLLQIRETPQVCLEEHQSFLKYTGLKPHQIIIYNVFQNPEFKPQIIQGYDALFIGGASSASVLEPEKYPFIFNAQALLHYCIARDIPVFASCFGFQLAVTALGGKIIRDESDYEMGTVEISRVPDIEDDPVFSGVGDKFMAVTVHQERTLSPPDNCQLLAFTDNSCHSFRIRKKPFWAFQFHPEVDKDILVQRLTVYKKKYTNNDTHLNDVLSFAVDTPVANSLPSAFVNKVLLG